VQIKLDNRLSAAAALVIPGQTAADIGTDHLLLPLYLVQSGITPRVIASDKARPPYENALSLARQAQLAQQIEVRLGKGLEVLNPGEAATIVIAGLGGRLMREILTAAPQILAATQRLVLQPQKDAALVRRWLANNGWRIVAESIACEGGRYYQLLAAEPGAMRLSETQAEFGPCLIGEPSPLFVSYLTREKIQISALIGCLQTQTGASAISRARQLRRQLQKIEEVLAGLADRESARN
jgi:tRNA (adenine22-N1)-methyltransferase